MKLLPNSIAQGLNSGAAYLCHIVCITRRDGQRFGFCDHDQALEFMGVSCVPQSAMIMGAAQTELGLTGDSHAAFSGIVGGESLQAGDIRAGMFDGARVDIYRVNWKTPEDYVHHACGLISEIECRGGLDDSQGQFIAHTDAIGSLLDRTIGRRYSHLCDAALGDARCSLSAVTIAGQVCDKRFATCKNRFGNGVNFRGFPDIPGEDYLSLYPHEGEPKDGTSRRIGSGR